MNIEELKNMVGLVKEVVFHDIFGKQDVHGDILTIEGIIANQTGDPETAHAFVLELKEISRLLHTDVDAVIKNDPAAVSPEEIVFCYPAIKEMVYYRIAHALLKLDVKLIPRVLTELAHSETGIDIHPAAKIGDHFAIDHGTGIVIGETAVIGSNVLLYQGVTLGARNFEYDSEGKPKDIPRHPIIEDNVTVYSNTSILGRVRIGHDSIIGGNVWLTHDVPPYSKVLQGKIETTTETLR